MSAHGTKRQRCVSECVKIIAARRAEADVAPVGDAVDGTPDGTPADGTVDGTVWSCRRCYTW